MPRILMLMVAGLLAGCASMQAYQAQVKLYQDLADQATAHFGAGGVRVAVSERAGVGGQYDRLSRTIILVPLREPTMRLILAHELGHHVLGHTGAALAQEQEANAMGVTVLQVWGMSEEAAFRAMAGRRLGLAEHALANTLAGHDYCAEVYDLWRRYPNYPPKDPAKVNSICPGRGAGGNKP